MMCSLNRCRRMDSVGISTRSAWSGCHTLSTQAAQSESRKSQPYISTGCDINVESFSNENRLIYVSMEQSLGALELRSLSESKTRHI